MFRTLALLASSALLILSACKASDSTPGVRDGLRVTRAQFDQLRNGMSYSEVRSILGGDCEIKSETGTEGAGFHMIVYGCDGRGSSVANMTFIIQDGKLINKTQVGLR
jgi:hypothetical protein